MVALSIPLSIPILVQAPSLFPSPISLSLSNLPLRFPLQYPYPFPSPNSLSLSLSLFVKKFGKGVWKGIGILEREGDREIREGKGEGLWREKRIESDREVPPQTPNKYPLLTKMNFIDTPWSKPVRNYR